MSERIYNLSAGPAVLPEEVVKKVQSNLYNYENSGLGIMEISHRGSHFKDIIHKAVTGLRSLLDISDDYEVLFSTGGATQQFSMVPMNLLGKDATADYIITGAWAKKAASEAKKFGEVHFAADSSDKNFSYLPKELSLSDKSAYVHFTSNNTIFGTQYSSEPEVGDRLLACDASSDFLHKKIDISKYGVVYAGAQKNVGPAGVTIVVIRKDWLDRAPEGLPALLDYRTLAEKESMYNTPPTFPIYVVAEVTEWLQNLGGLDAIYERNKKKAQVLYSFLDSSEFYKAVVAKEDRSLMNVTFRIADESLESAFIEEASKKGLNGLKGHRSVGGMRASIYNAFPEKGVDALVAFMKEFEATKG